MARRSVLFTPGDRGEMQRKAVESAADVVVFDLEDGVAPANRSAARETVRETLGEIDGGSVDPEVCVRVNADPDIAAADIDGAFGPNATPDSVMLPKADSAAAVDRLAGQLADRGHDAPILALLETAAGILHAEAIAGAEATAAVLFGAEDLAGDVGALRTDEGTEVLAARSQVVLAASAAGIDAIDTHYPDYQDLDGLRAETAFAMELGYDGKMALHPEQVRVINEAFTPDSDRIDWARQILAAASDHPDKAVFVLEGEMIDAPQIRQAERIRDRARAAGEWAER